VDKLLIYKTPKEIEQYILKQIIIANPPYFQKKRIEAKGKEDDFTYF